MTVPTMAASSITVTVPASVPSAQARATAAIPTTTALATEARRKTRIVPYRSTTAPARPNAIRRGIHSSMKARPVSAALPVVARTSIGMV